MAYILFRVGGEDRGVFFPSTKRIIVYLDGHECIEDIYKTIQHEVIHLAIDNLDEELDDDQEEKAIFAMAWAEESI
jgi:hypothetical protein